MKNTPEDRAYFFDDGLEFTCQGCGACCTGDPGIVQVSADEAKKIADFLQKPIEEMLGKELFLHLGGYRLHEDPESGACVFLNKDQCEIYEFRPIQCRTWPFWLENLRSPKAWRRATRSCSGIGKGRRYTREEILEILARS